MLFIPQKNEMDLISIITKYNRNDYILLRFTPTMLKKSIIDASGNIRSLLKNNNLVDYDTLTPGQDKLVLDGFLITNEVTEQQLSFYRPQTKKGDPRFWIYNFRQVIRDSEMIYLTIFNNKICIVPLVESQFNEEIIKDFFMSEEDNSDLNECLALLKDIMYKDIISVSPSKSYAKDVGDTLEKCLKMKPNSDKHADFNNKIELKGKRKGKNSKDTLFSMVPDWDLSNIKSSPEMILTYGYESTKEKYSGFIDLFVTVSNKVNNQGLYLEVDDENEVLIQKHVEADGSVTDSCIWTFEELKERLNLKHPETLWVLADEKRINGEIYFNYEQIEHTKSPIFNSFLLLISQGIITFDWRGRVKANSTGYKDKGHCFRLKPKYRNLLFGELEEIHL
ncbi:hypothetical protein CCS79_03050 [Clostridium diolis]|uniref:MvaI/BcnI family restriction endonuclease n=1 Tax=Clostridium diolis TaxID=223919 RepID=UPI000B400759|nr:MvaI/BcnI family restriction endonuclease [Clostridium diolis]OVE70003.1 hypothetical protein CCS79_03050 [Clostridium diolis]